MITKLNHIAIILFSDESISFYEKLGFRIAETIDRGYDKLVFMEGASIVLEIFVDPTHPKRTDNPEAMGLRHLAFDVDDLEATVRELGVTAETIRENRGQRYVFVKDFDGNPIELRESIGR